MKYAYIFDVDGVLVNTMEMLFACYKQALEEVSFPIDKAQFFRQAGMKGQEQIKYFAEKAGIAVDAEEVYQRKRELSDKRAQDVKQIECNVELIRALKAAGFLVAMASASARASWVHVVGTLGISADAAVGAEDVTRGKPHPDLFLCAAEKLGVPPENCIVIEDSDVGVEAAKAAGMKVVRFYDSRGK